MKVVQLPVGNVNDVPARLRDLADTLEQGAKEGVIVGVDGSKMLAWVNIDVNGDIGVGALGLSHDDLHCVGILQAGITKLLTERT